MPQSEGGKAPDMRSVLEEITALRNGKPPVTDRRNSNRYCLVCTEENGTKTAYCFGVPIYNSHSKRLIDLRFCESGKTLRAYGSSAAASVTDEIFLEDEYGCCRIGLPKAKACLSGRGLKYGNTVIYPTANGILIKADCTVHRPFSVCLSVGQPFMPIRANDRAFSLMREEFKPFVTVSCIGVLDSAGHLIAPCVLEYQKNSDCEYLLDMKHTSPYGVTLLFEINMHVEKLFRDTTVESLHPDVNNAFGSIAFVGKTAAYGEQWLYSQPDFSKLPELYDKRIHKAVLHLPCLGGGNTLTAFGLRARFCSFGSDWDNKIMSAEEISDTVFSGGYQSLDITDLITDDTHFLKPPEGLILRAKANSAGFSAVSTGDSCFVPQILEVNFR